MAAGGVVGVLRRTVEQPLSQAGLLAAYTIEGLRGTADVRRWGADFVRECWFLISVTALPVVAIGIPLSATISLQLGDLSRQLGARSATGAIVAVAVVREVAPMATAVITAGAGGSAMAADVGARRIRQELDAMQVMGVDPVRRLVTPRLWASAVVSTLLIGLVILAGITGGFLFNVVLQGTSPGAYLTGATSLLQAADLVQALVKAAVFGLIAGVVACAEGMTCDHGPVGVGRAVNRSVVVTFVLVFAVNTIITALYLALVPQRL